MLPVMPWKEAFLWPVQLSQWLREGVGLIDTSAEIESLARQVKDNGGVYLIPAFVGLGAPYWDPHARGLMIGLTRGTTRRAYCSGCIRINNIPVQ